MRSVFKCILHGDLEVTSTAFPVQNVSVSVHFCLSVIVLDKPSRCPILLSLRHQGRHRDRCEKRGHRATVSGNPVGNSPPTPFLPHLEHRSWIDLGHHLLL